MQVPFNKPTLPRWSIFRDSVQVSYETGYITNGPKVAQLESEAVNRLGDVRAIGVSCCTSGLMLALRCLGLRGKVALPSFTFFASAHALVWNGLEPVFVDIDEDTWNISLSGLEEALAEEAVTGVLPVHVFGNPCDVAASSDLAERAGIKVIYDAAHAMGSKVGDMRVGCFGDAEVFSLSPTKLVVAGEGGIVTTKNEKLAEMLRAGRDYGNSGDYDPAFVGLNARMSEFHAALAIESLRMLEDNVRRRNEIAARYRQGLGDLPGISFQAVKDGNRSTYKDFTIRVDEEGFGMGRDVLAWHLAREGIDTRKYYYPPVHRTKAYWERWGKKYDDRLPITNALSESALSLPIWSHMELDIVDMVAVKINEAHERAEAIKADYLKQA